MKNVILTFDGGAKPNPGKGYGSYNIRIDDNIEPIYGELETPYGSNLTSNQAEYIAVTRGAKKVGELFRKECNLMIIGDSELVLKQISGEYRVKSEKLLPLYHELMEHLRSLNSYKVQHRPRIGSVEEFGH